MKVKILAILAGVIFFGSTAYGFYTPDMPTLPEHKITQTRHFVAKVTPPPAPQPTPPPPPVTAPKPVTQASCTTPDNNIEALINNYRVSQGRKRLCADQRLRNAAAAHAKYLCENNQFSHTGYASYAVAAGWTRPVGENLESGEPNAEMVLEGWQNSPEHNQNMLDEIYSYQGIGSADCQNYQGNGMQNITTIVSEYLGV